MDAWCRALLSLTIGGGWLATFGMGSTFDTRHLLINNPRIERTRKKEGRRAIKASKLRCYPSSL
jgi:hypothetical protein